MKISVCCFIFSIVSLTLSLILYVRDDILYINCIHPYCATQYNVLLYINDLKVFKEGGAYSQYFYKFRLGCFKNSTTMIPTTSPTTTSELLLNAPTRSPIKLDYVEPIFKKDMNCVETLNKILLGIVISSSIILLISFVLLCYFDCTINLHKINPIV